MIERDNKMVHQPVLLESSVNHLITHKDGIYVDGTYGRGGHSQAILDNISPNAKLLVFDQDIEAITVAEKKQKQDSRIEIFHENFRYLHRELEKHGFKGRINGLLLDIGVSSPQLDNPIRGFSFQQSGPLDMRMNNQRGSTALEWLKTTQVEQIKRDFKDFADVRNAGKWARMIKDKVAIGDVQSTGDLASLIEKHTSKKTQLQMNVHPATRIFQAIRIAVNEEIPALKEGLQGAKEILCQGGKLVVLSFHSVEHRLLRRFAREDKDLPFNFPQVEKKDWRIIRLLDYPNDEEIEQNRRARSARLTVLEKIG